MDYYRARDKKRDDDAKRDDVEFINERNLLLRVYGTDDGRALLLREMGESFFFTTTFTGNSSTFLREGQRKRLLAIMEMIPDLVAEVLANYAAQRVAEFRAVEDDLLKGRKEKHHG